MRRSTRPNQRRQAYTETRAHLHRFDDLLQHIRRRTSDRIRYDSEKACVNCRYGADITLSVAISELLDHLVSVKGQAARDKPGRGETVRKGVDGGWYRMEGEVDEQAASEGWCREFPLQTGTNPISYLRTQSKVADDSFSTRRPNNCKLPRLDLSGVRPPMSSTSPSSSTYAGHARPTQPASHRSRKTSKQPFPRTKIALRPRAMAGPQRTRPPLTARKQTAQTGNVHKMNMASLLRTAQRFSVVFFSLVSSFLLI